MSAPAKPTSPEVGQEIVAGGYVTNLHDHGDGSPVMLIHGSGPGVTAWANWRLLMPVLASRRRVIAPDMFGFGYSERPPQADYRRDAWVEHAVGVLDALDIERADLIGNSFGGGIALALAIKYPHRVRRMVLMGSVGVSFPITKGLDAVWGYEPSFNAMRALMDLFAYDRKLVTDELTALRYQSSIQPGFQESYAAMFPAPRQRWIDGLASKREAIRDVPHEALIIHGREDLVIPLQASLELASLIERAQLHVFGLCGHWTQIEHAGRFARLVEDFLSEADSVPEEE